MKVYVVKNVDNDYATGYMTETGDFIDSLWQADLFNDYETAKCYAPAGCRVVECFLMETTELAEHDKEVRKEVCGEIKEALCMTEQNTISNTANVVYYDELNNLLNRIQGERK